MKSLRIFTTFILSLSIALGAAAQETNNAADPIDPDADLKATRILMKAYLQSEIEMDSMVEDLMEDVERLPNKLQVVREEVARANPMVNVDAYAKVMELQGELDEAFDNHNRTAVKKRKKYRAWGHWGGLIGGFVLSAGYTYFRAKSMSDFGPIVLAMVVIPAGTAAGWGLGTTIGERMARNVDLAPYTDLVSEEPAVVNRDLLAKYSPVELFKLYMEGKANAVDVATSLLESGDGLKSQWSSVRNAAQRDYDLSAKSDDRVKMIRLEHKLRMKITEHNEAIVEKIAKGRTWGGIGGAVLAGGTVLTLKIRASYRHKVTANTIFFSLVAATAGGTLGYVITPKIVEWIADDPIEMDSAFD